MDLERLQPRWPRPALISTLALFLALAWTTAPPPLWADEESSTTTTKSADPSWTPELILRYRGIDSTAVSDDGSLVAYVVSHPETEGEKSEFIDRIRIAAVDGSTDHRYTRTDVSSSSPAFSPDGRLLAFLSKRGERQQIWLLRVRGGEAEALTEAEADVSSFQWSPDGRSIAYLMADPETEDDKTREKEKRDVILVGQNYKYSHLYLVAVEADRQGPATGRRLTEGSFHITGFDWSPDGERIVFAHRRDPRINTDRVDGDLSLVVVADAEMTSLYAGGGVERAPRFSPDGQLVAFLSDGERPEAVGLRDVYVVNLAAGNQPPRALAHTHDRNATLIGWSGREVLVTETRGTTVQVLAVPASGEPVRGVSDVSGRISAVAINRGGQRLVYVFEDTEEPAEVYTSKVSNFAGVRLTSVHRDVPRPPMGLTERLTWKSKDGLEIEGLLTYPVGHQKGQFHPLVLVIHGGPAGAHVERFTGSPGIYMYQYFAQHGYALLSPNPRGSAGYGKDFRYANVRDWGYGDYEDLMSGVDKVIELGVADPEQLFVMGWSYGGYMTSFLVTRTDRFRAASMGAGLPNLISMVHTTDISDYLTAHMGAELWDDYEVYEKHSAIYRVGKVKTPTQVIHGAEDLRVPFTQGQEFYVALQRRNIPTEMVVYPRTPHGPREPKFEVDISPRILTWFEKWRQPSPPSSDGDPDDGY